MSVELCYLRSKRTFHKMWEFSFKRQPSNPQRIFCLRGRAYYLSNTTPYSSVDMSWLWTLDTVIKNISITQTRKTLFSFSNSTQTLKLELPYSVNNYRTFLTWHKTFISWKTVVRNTCISMYTHRPGQRR